MRKRVIRHSILLAFVIAFSGFFSGCASVGPTKPNPVYNGPYPDKFNGLVQKNPLLAEELSKLPEILDAISPSEASALEKIAEIYHGNPEQFDKAFGEMYQEGLPEVRKYCSPLQALFWLAEDGELNNENNPLIDYSLDKLLYMAWSKHRSLSLSDQQLLEIIDNLKDERKKKTYLLKKQFNNNDTMWELITQDYSRNRSIFSEKAQIIIEQSLKSKHDTRWKNFCIVTDRLNSPGLLNYYEQKNFKYRDLGLRIAPSGPAPSFIFYNKKEGSCSYYTSFSVYCLRKAGYSARAIMVKGIRGLKHVVCEYEDEDGMVYILDNSCLACGSGTGITKREHYLKKIPQIGVGYSLY